MVPPGKPGVGVNTNEPFLYQTSVPLLGTGVVTDSTSSLFDTSLPLLSTASSLASMLPLIGLGSQVSSKMSGLGVIVTVGRVSGHVASTVMSTRPSPK